MLQDYINDYIDAEKKGDSRKMSRIESDVALLGIDRYTLRMIAREEKRNAEDQA
ncbi:MAG: hypothetical protein IJV16_00020 [Lachnospiraceae bacterium]|nr:hypothetical protein [Lachnospiraceae bacterium]